MAKTLIEIRAETSQFQAAMKQCSAEMKNLDSQYSLAATQAKINGSAQDELRARITNLTGKIDLQKESVAKNCTQYDNLKNKLDIQKSQHEQLKAKVEAAKKAYEESAEATGKDSEQTQKLKAEYEKLQGQLNASESAIQKTETALTKQDTAINKSKESLAQYEQQLKEANAQLAAAPFNEYAEKAEKVGGTLTSAGEKLAPVSLGVAAVGTAAVKTAADFDKSMSQVQATMGITSDSTTNLNGKTVNTMQSLEQLARTMGEKTKFSASEAADAINILAMAGEDTDTIYKTLPSTLNLAAAGGLEIADAADIATGVMSGFGLQADQCSHVADVLATTASSAKGSVSDFGSGLATVAGQASVTGQSLEDTATALGILGNHNIAAAEGGNMLQRVLKNLYQPTDTAKQALDQLGVSAYDSTGKARPLQDVLQDLNGKLGTLSQEDYNSTMGQIFDTAALRGAAFLIQDSGDQFDNLKGKINGCAGAAENMAAVQEDNLEGQLTILKSQLEELAISFGEALMPSIRDVVSKIQSFVDKLNGMDEGTRNMIIKVGLFVAALSPCLIALGKVITFSGQVSGAIGKLVEGWTKLGGAAGLATKASGLFSSALGFITSPAGIVVAAIAALVAVIVTLWHTNEDFRNKVTEIWNNIKEVFSGFVDGIKQRLAELGISFSDITNAIKTVWEGFCNLLAPVIEGAFQAIATVLQTVFGVITGLLDIFIGVFTGDWSQAWQGVKEVFSSIWDGIKGIVSTVLETIKGVVNVFLGWFGTDWDTVWTNIKTFFENIWNGISTFFSTIWNGIKTVVTTVATDISNTITTIFTAISTFFSTIWNGIVTVVTTVWETIKNVVQVGLMFIEELIKAAFDLITLPFRFIWENCKEEITAAWNAIKSVVTTAANAVKSVIETVFNAVKAFVTTVWNGIKSVTTTVWNGIKGVVTTVVNAIKSVVTTVVNAIKSVVTTVWNAIKSATTTAWNGIKSVTTTVWNGIKGVVTTVVNAIKSVVTTVFNAVKSVVTTIWNGIKSVTTSTWNAIKSAVSTPINAIKSAVSSGLNAVKSTVSSIWNGIKSVTTSTWNAIKNAITRPITAAKDAVGRTISAIRSKFNFSWSLPHLKLPHPSIYGHFSLNPPSVPHFSISWYKNGGIMTQPTVFGMNGSNILAGGEAGAEAILPLTMFFNNLSEMLDKKLQQMTSNTVVHVYVTLDGEVVAEHVYTRVENDFVRAQQRAR